MRLIKQLLRECLPGVRVFLDDSLNDASRLEKELNDFKDTLDVATKDEKMQDYIPKGLRTKADTTIPKVKVVLAEIDMALEPEAEGRFKDLSFQAKESKEELERISRSLDVLLEEAKHYTNQ